MAVEGRLAGEHGQIHDLLQKLKNPGSSFPASFAADIPYLGGAIC